MQRKTNWRKSFSKNRSWIKKNPYWKKGKFWKKCENNTQILWSKNKNKVMRTVQFKSISIRNFV